MPRVKGSGGKGAHSGKGGKGSGKGGKSGKDGNDGKGGKSLGKGGKDFGTGQKRGRGGQSAGKGASRDSTEVRKRWVPVRSQSSGKGAGKRSGKRWVPKRVVEEVPVPGPAPSGGATPAPEPERVAEHAPLPGPERVAEQAPAPEPERFAEPPPAPVPETVAEQIPETVSPETVPETVSAERPPALVSETVAMQAAAPKSGTVDAPIPNVQIASPQPRPIPSRPTAPSAAAWLVLMGPQQSHIDPDQWMSYDSNVAFLLNQQSTVMKQEKGQEGYGILLDLSYYSNPPQPYFIEKGRKILVANPVAQAVDPRWHLGEVTVAGHPTSWWDGVSRNAKFLPASVRHGAAQGYYYQILQEHKPLLEQLERFLEDRTGQERHPDVNPRRRIVVQVLFPSSFSSTRRFAPTTRVPPRPAPEAPQPEESAQDVTEIEDKGDTGTKIPAVYEWWFGPAPKQHELQGRAPDGRWKMYHPKVCQHLERTHRQQETGFQDARQPTDIDNVRYMMQKVTTQTPFDKRGEPSREPFTAEHIITIDHPCFAGMDVASNNCFVQFQKGNPARRRPARRRPDGEELARAANMTNTPCQICFTEDGYLTGCNKAHGVCKSCLRGALRALVGDITQQEHLICGCFTRKNRAPLKVLAERADIDLHELKDNPPQDPIEKQDAEMELSQMRIHFSLGEEIPGNFYQEKVLEWYRKVNMKEIEHLYHPCKHPSCRDKMENWILIEDFENDFQSKGICVWTCKDGHLNSVLPSQEELDEMNKNLLLHPEYYEERAYYDQVPLRRYRLCEQCAVGGILMLAAHGGACKQWPGGGAGRGHRHCFCFACARPWNEPGGCKHGEPTCTDPGIQQVRPNATGDGCEVGYVDGESYIRWLKDRHNTSTLPPTRFAGGAPEPGAERQARLHLTDKARLLAESQRGTT